MLGCSGFIGILYILLAPFSSLLDAFSTFSVGKERSKDGCLSAGAFHEAVEVCRCAYGLGSPELSVRTGAMVGVEPKALSDLANKDWSSWLSSMSCSGGGRQGRGR